MVPTIIIIYMYGKGRPKIEPLKNDEINRTYPEGTKITEDNMNFSGDDIFKGYLTNIMDDAPLDVQISEKNLVTKHFGKNSTFY